MSGELQEHFISHCQADVMYIPKALDRLRVVIMQELNNQLPKTALQSGCENRAQNFIVDASVTYSKAHERDGGLKRKHRATTRLLISPSG